MSMMYLIRHGQASFGAEKYDKLSEKGIRQAHILGEHLCASGIMPHAIYAGTMARQTHTAQEVRACYAAQGTVLPEPVILSGLDEFDTTAIILSQIQAMQEEDPSLARDLPRMYEDKESFKRIFEGAMLRWVCGDNGTGGFESWDTFRGRVVDTLLTIMAEQEKGRTVFVFTSGGPIAATLQHVLGLMPERAIRLNWQVVNTSYTKYMYNNGRITMAGFNCISHLELHGERSSLISYR